MNCTWGIWEGAGAGVCAAGCCGNTCPFAFGGNNVFVKSSSPLVSCPVPIPNGAGAWEELFVAENGLMLILNWSARMRPCGFPSSSSPGLNEDEPGDRRNGGNCIDGGWDGSEASGAAVAGCIKSFTLIRRLVEAAALRVKRETRGDNCVAQCRSTKHENRGFAR